MSESGIHLCDPVTKDFLGPMILRLDSFALVIIIVAFGVAITWLVAQFKARRKFYRRIVAEARSPVLVYNSRGKLVDLTPGLLIFERRPAEPITSLQGLSTHLSHSKNQVEIDSIVYRCAVKSLVDKKWGEYVVAELAVKGRKN